MRISYGNFAAGGQMHGYDTGNAAGGYLTWQRVAVFISYTDKPRVQYRFLVLLISYHIYLSLWALS